jgi:hypothetical protein
MGSYAKFKKANSFLEAIVFMVSKGSQDIIEQVLDNVKRHGSITSEVTQQDTPSVTNMDLALPKMC